MLRPTREYRNLVLAALPKAEITRLAPHLSPVTLKVRDELLNGKSKYAYFLEDGLASVVLPMESGATVEVGVIGRDGVVGLPMLLGLIDYSRGHVTVKSRQKLEGAACECYRVVRDEFDRLGLF